MISQKKLIKKCGSYRAAIWTCEDKIKLLKVLLKRLTTTTEIDEYKKKLSNWQSLRIELTNQLNK